MLSEEKKIKLRDDEVLHAHIVEKGNPVWLIVTHGLGEYSKRHQYMYDLFAQYFNICIYDLRGHGLSTGKRGAVNNFKDYTKDLGEVVEYLKEGYLMDRFVLFGHSMGGLITASFMQNEVQANTYPEKVFLSAPAVAGTGFMGQLFQLAPMTLMNLLRALPVSIALAGLLDLSKLSHDPRVYEAYVADPLNILKIHTKLVFELVSESRDVFSRPLRINCDLYCSVGSEDGLVNAKAVEEYFTQVEKNSKFMRIEGGYHELHNEIDKYSDQYFEFLKHSLLP